MEEETRPTSISEQSKKNDDTPRRDVQNDPQNDPRSITERRPQGEMQDEKGQDSSVLLQAAMPSAAAPPPPWPAVNHLCSMLGHQSVTSSSGERDQLDAWPALPAALVRLAGVNVRARTTRRPQTRNHGSQR